MNKSNDKYTKVGTTFRCDVYEIKWNTFIMEMPSKCVLCMILQQEVDNFAMKKLSSSNTTDFASKWGSKKWPTRWVVDQV